MIYFPSRFDSFPVYDKLNYYLINLDTFFTIWYHFIHVNRNILAKREYPRSCTITDKFVVKKSGIKRGTWGFSKFLLVQLFAFCIVRNRHKLPSYENYPSRSNQRVVPQSRLSLTPMLARPPPNPCCLQMYTRAQRVGRTCTRCSRKGGGVIIENHV